MTAPGLKRVDYLLSEHLQLAWDFAKRRRMDPHLYVDREQGVFPLLASCDPTGRYLSWILRWRRSQWQAGDTFAAPSYTDVCRLGLAIADFQRVQRYLPANLRDISKYKTLGDLSNCEFAVNSTAAINLKKAARDLAQRESTTLFRQDRWRIVRVHTEAAARWWGMGTRWCTASRERNSFDRYATRGPIFILLTPTGKYQLHPASDEVRDAADRPVDLEITTRGSPPGFSKALNDISGDGDCPLSDSPFDDLARWSPAEPEVDERDAEEWRAGWFWELELDHRLF